tara:strand:- start:509 stop:766 length:258 start_codon:yes stop_codon:yes gene_type:complete
MDNKLKKFLMDNGCLLADGYDDALVGTALKEGEIVSVYSTEKCIEILMADGMDHQEAAEFFYYNTHDAYVGKKTPIYINTHNEGE